MDVCTKHGNGWDEGGLVGVIDGTMLFYHPCCPNVFQRLSFHSAVPAQQMLFDTCDLAALAGSSQHYWSCLSLNSSSKVLLLHSPCRVTVILMIVQ